MTEFNSSGRITIKVKLSTREKELANTDSDIQINMMQNNYNSFIKRRSKSRYFFIFNIFWTKLQFLVLYNFVYTSQWLTTEWRSEWLREEQNRFVGELRSLKKISTAKPKFTNLQNASLPVLQKKIDGTRIEIKRTNWK